MPLGKQAKTLSKGQLDALLGYVTKTRHTIRNRTIVMLSAKAGLRAKEIAGLTWEMVTDPEGGIGNAIHLQDTASKGKSGRIIPLNAQLKDALVDLLADPSSCKSEYVIVTERSKRTSAQAIVNLFFRWFREVGFSGCSSHSGRRTFITGTARKISSVGGSLRDVQKLAGHSSLRTTQQYIDENEDAQIRVVSLI